MKKFVTVAMAAAFPLQTFACSVCFSGREDFLGAFYLTTAMLIVLPPTLLGSIIYFLRKKIKSAQQEQELEL